MKKTKKQKARELLTKIDPAEEYTGKFFDLIEETKGIKKDVNIINKNHEERIKSILEDLKSKREGDIKTISRLSQSISDLTSSGSVTQKELSKVSNSFNKLLDSFEKDKKSILKDMESFASTSDYKNATKEIALLVEEVSKIWIEIKNL